MNEFDNSYSQQTQVSEGQVAAYLTRVMGWMALGLLTTFTVILLSLASRSFLAVLVSNPVIYYGVIILELVVVIAMNASAHKLSSTSATVMFLLYSALNGVTMTVFCLIFETISIMTVFVLTAGIFLMLAVYGFVTKKDMTKMGTMAIFGLGGIILVSLVNIFLKNSVIDFIVCIVGVIIFIGLTVYDTQKIKNRYISAMASGHTDESELVKKTAIFGALTLYLDFINLFIKLLRIFGKKR